MLSITSISFRTPGISRGGGAGAWPGAIWLAVLLEDRGKEREREIGAGSANRMAATFMPLSAFRPARHRWCISLFIFRLLNYIPINNALTTPDELIYHSTGTAGGSGIGVLREAVKSSHLSSDSRARVLRLPEGSVHHFAFSTTRDHRITVTLRFFFRTAFLLVEKTKIDRKLFENRVKNRRFERKERGRGSRKGKATEYVGV